MGVCAYVPLSTNSQEKTRQICNAVVTVLQKLGKLKFDNEIVPVAVPKEKEILLWCPKMKNTPM
jgi:hypothetical protein